MKKLLIIFFLLLCFPSSALAQGKGSRQYYEDLLQSYRQYQGQIETFTTKKSRFLTYKSVEAQAEFLATSKSLLSAEIIALKDYSYFIKTYLAEATQILQYTENLLYVKLDDEISFLTLAQENVNSLSSLAEVKTALNDLSSHYQKIVNYGFQIKSLVEVESTKKVVENLKVERDKIEQVLSLADQKTTKVMAAKEKFASLQKDLADIEVILSRAVSEQKAVAGSDEPKESANQVRATLKQINLKLNPLVSNWQDIIFSLKP